MSAVTDAIEALRQAMLDEGQEPDLVEAKLHAVKPNETNLVGNFADLNRAGAAAVTEGGSDLDYEDMTKAELQAELDSRGIEYSQADTKADLIAALEG